MCHNQVCPPGTIGTYPDCVTPPDDKCKDDETGVFPNCVKKAAVLSQAKIKVKAKVKSGKSMAVNYSVKNSGNAAASNVKVCLTLKKAKKLAKGKATRCKTIKTIGELSRKEIAEAAECKVHLFLFVKVREDWADDPARYREMGLEFPKD